MFGIGKLIYLAIFSINGIAVLSEDRFLNRIGWGSQSVGSSNTQFQQLSGNAIEEGNIKVRLINLIVAIRTLLRLPLIFINLIVILYEVLLG